MNPAPELFTGNASKKLFFVLYVTTAKEQSYLTKKSIKLCGFLFLQKSNIHLSLLAKYIMIIYNNISYINTVTYT